MPVSRLSRAMAVSPPRTLSPGLTRISVSRGRSTSVREPNRIIPNRSPLSTTSPTCFQAQIRRAIAPVIWRTTMVTPFPRIAHVRRALISEEAGFRASRNRPVMGSECVISPAMGARFTWTSKTERKIVTRFTRWLMNWLSPVSFTSTTSPSAGATASISSEAAGAQDHGKSRVKTGAARERQARCRKQSQRGEPACREDGENPTSFAECAKFHGLTIILKAASGRAHS